MVKRRVVHFEEDVLKGMKDNNMVHEKVDGRFNGISDGVNTMCRDYLKRIGRI